MADGVGSGAQGIPKRFLDLSADVREERLVRYVIKQLGQGRHIDDVMKDEEVAALSSEVTRTELMEQPEVLREIEEQVQRDFSSYKIGATSGTEQSDTDQEAGPKS